jgi:histidinol phosphatase-like enzyme (inositol monophosphatase family)
MTELEAFAVDLARAAADASLPLFRTGAEIEDKNAGGPCDPVTLADRNAEAAMRRLIAERYPDHGVIGEEYGEDRPDAEHVWVLDPVDGTRAFVAGLPLWTTLIGLKVAGAPSVGVVAQPYLDEIFVGGPSGARLMRAGSETPLAVRTCPNLNDAVIATTDPDIFTGAELGAWRQVRAAARLARLGCDAYAYAMVAAGHVDLVAETGLKEWDWTALVPLVKAAGGHVTDWLGGEAGTDGRVLAVGDAALTDQALVALKRAVV